jgi:cellulose synthase/poly-beta-1,6-N-acetylglucosamine synthase-like glycosyltransferase
MNTQQRVGLPHATLAKLVGLVMVFLFIRSAIPAEPTLSASVSQWAYRGISYVAYWRNLYSSPQSDQSLALLAATGANSVSIIVTCYQETITSTEILCLTDSQTPTDDDLRHVIARAHQLGLAVMLKPIIDLSNDPTHWRGEIGFGTDETA